MNQNENKLSLIDKFKTITTNELEHSILEKKFLSNEVSKEAIIQLHSTMIKELPKYEETINNILDGLNADLLELKEAKDNNEIDFKEYRSLKKEIEKEKLDIQERYKKYILDFVNSKQVSSNTGDGKNSFYFIELVKKMQEETSAYSNNTNMIDVEITEEQANAKRLKKIDKQDNDLLGSFL